MVSTYCVSSPATTFHAVASGAIAAGDLVSSASTTDVMTAISSAGYVEGAVLVQKATNAHDAIIVGVALNDAATTATVGVITQGLFIFETGAAVTTGALVAQETTAQKVETATAFGKVIGRALTGGSTSGKYVLVRLF